MNIGSICQREVITVGPELDLWEAAELMREHHVGFLVVVPTQARHSRTPIAVVTDRDIVVSVVARRADPATLRVADVMSTKPVVIGEGDAVDVALKAMRRAGVRRLPVVDGRGELVGVLSLDDLLDLIAEEIESLAGAVRNERQIEGALRN